MTETNDVEMVNLEELKNNVETNADMDISDQSEYESDDENTSNLDGMRIDEATVGMLLADDR